jgi:chemotaxis protein CheD
MRRAAHPFPALFLKPGEMVVSDGPLVVSTLLGSCVAVTMYVPRLRVGAICHSLLPSCRNTEPCRHEPAEAGKYVECAIRRMLETLLARGASRGEIEVKVFGGSDMFEVADKGQSIGRQNIDKALALVAGESLKLVKKDLGGTRGRKLIFHCHTGDVYLRRLKTTEK